MNTVKSNPNEPKTINCLADLKCEIGQPDQAGSGELTRSGLHQGVNEVRNDNNKIPASKAINESATLMAREVENDKRDEGGAA
jgi:hypothetical protein